MTERNAEESVITMRFALLVDLMSREEFVLGKSLSTASNIFHRTHIGKGKRLDLAVISLFSHFGAKKGLRCVPRPRTSEIIASQNPLDHTF